jgi:hypothetical protein
VMTRLTGLEGLRSVGYQTRIRGNPALVSISSLDALTDAGTDGIRITENDALQRIDGVRALVSMQPRASIYITDDRALTQVDGFDRVEVTSTLEVYGAKVATIHGFGALTLATGSVRLIVPTLRTLDALGSLARVDGDVLLQAKALASMRELSALTSVGGELFIGQCGITSAGDLRSLRTVGGRLTFAGDPALLHVNVLPSLTGVGELVVIDNATLPACDAQGLLDALVAKGFVGTATLDKNDGTGACN